MPRRHGVIARPVRPRALARLLLAQGPCALGIALLIRSGLGAAPWDVFHLGLHRATGLDIGLATTLTSLAALLLALAWGVRPGVGTVVTVALLGACVDAALAVVPGPRGAAPAAAYVGGGVLLFGLGTGLYISAGLGNGPRDSLMLAIAARWRSPVWGARAVLELLALATGVALGARAGIGTIVYALAIGPVAQWGITLFAPRPWPPPHPSPSASPQPPTPRPSPRSASAPSATRSGPTTAPTTWTSTARRPTRSSASGARSPSRGA